MLKKVKSAYYKDCARQVIRTWNRFFAILVISAMGVAFFAGLRASGPDMRASADEYYDERRFFDYRLLSNIGFSDEDAVAVKRAIDPAPFPNRPEDYSPTGEPLLNEPQVTPAYSLDAMADGATSGGLTVRLLSLNKEPETGLNLPELLSGRRPASDSECLAEPVFLELAGIELGDTIRFGSGTKDKITQSLKYEEFTVVGTARSPLYVSSERGGNAVGSGRTESVLLLPFEAFTLPKYTDLYLSVPAASGLSRFGDAYKDAAEPAGSALETLLDERARINKEGLKNQAIDGALLAGLPIDPENPPEALLSGLPDPKYYILNVETNIALSGYAQDSKRVDGLSLVMPLLFFLVAVLVTMTSMTRLVDSDRAMIGTYKALGYKNGRIAARYLFYAISASFIGSAAGVIAGFNIFPRVVFGAYETLYHFPGLHVDFNWPSAALSCGFSVLCAAVPAWLVCVTSLRASPAELMRPLAPHGGKRIWLERVSLIWKHLNFSRKVAVRNLFRYKKRLIMTVIGVAGCTALMFAGFGMRDSISTITRKQYEEIQRFDLQIDVRQGSDLPALAGDTPEITDSLRLTQKSVEVTDGSQIRAATLLVPENAAELPGYFFLRDSKTKKAIPLPEEGAVISEKLASLYGLKPGDRVTVTADSQTYGVAVAAICENYLYHYLFMSPGAYESAFGEERELNQLLCHVTQNTDKPALSSRLLAQDNVSGVTFTSDLVSIFGKMADAMRTVVFVLTTSAAALVFVVLFSLSTINLEERGRELATIKVLGFFDPEVAMYTYRENISLVLLGTGVGLGLGVGIQRYIIGTMEVDMLMFSRSLLWQSYVYSAVLTLAFALIVNLIMYAFIKKIDMVSSLKSVE